jgi:ribosome-associated translation inhibitor RaiA
MNFEDRWIEVSDAPDLDGFEKAKVVESLSVSFDKLQRVVGKELFLHVHFKRHEVQGSREKHAVHLKLVFPGKTVVASESGWQPVEVLQAALKVLERETVEFVKKR